MREGSKGSSLKFLSKLYFKGEITMKDLFMFKVTTALENEEEKEFSFFPLAFIFSNAQVEPINLD